MKTGDLASAAAKMNLAMKTLRGRWEAARGQWTDGAAAAFEKVHIAKVEPEIAATLAAASRIAEVLERARQECSEQP
jgi:hypothetical protein